MNEVKFEQLNPIKLPLIKPIYKAFYPSARPKKNETIVVGYLNSKIVAIVRFRPIDNAFLLTGMLVVPEHRSSGVGSQLLQFCQAKYFNEAYFCFAFSHLEKLYQDVGFQIQTLPELPVSLQPLFQRYTLSGKNLIPMRYIT